MNTIRLTSDTQTKQLAKQLATISEPGDIFILTGDLGAGKTTFSKGFAEGLGIEQMIKSPTYTLIKEYDDGRLPLYHMDVYRLTDGASDLGLDDYLDGDGVCLIEWGELIKEEIGELPYIELFLTTIDESTRELRLSHSNHANRLESIQHFLNEVTD